MSYRRRFLSLVVAAFCAAIGRGGSPSSGAATDSGAAPELTIESRAPDEVTERIREDLAGLLERLRRFLPPEAPATTPIRVVVFVAFDDYREALKSEGITAANPACFVTAKRSIYLAHDGARYDAVQRSIQKRRADLLAALDVLQRRFADRRREDELRFKRENTPAERRKEIRRRAERDFDREKAAIASEVADVAKQAERARNDALDRLTKQAAHEFFHAYVAVELFPTAERGLPAWLNEGMAQVVEFARWTEADGPQAQTAELARQWREAGLSAQKPPSLESVLRSDTAGYLMHDPTARDEVRRRYVAAWSLATFLVEDGKLQDRAAFRRYASEIDADPVARFERFVGEPLSTFEDRWGAFLRRNRFAN